MFALTSNTLLRSVVTGLPKYQQMVWQRASTENLEAQFRMPSQLEGFSVQFSTWTALPEQ